jgi:putative transposase
MDQKFDSDTAFLLHKISYHAACMYNVANYEIRQAWFNRKQKLSYNENYHRIKDNEHFSILINDCSSQIARKAHQDFNSFLGLLKLKNKGKYDEKINIPRYKREKNGKKEYDIIIQGRSVRFVKSLHKVNVYQVNTSKTFRSLYPDFKTSFEIKVPKHIGKLNQLTIKPSKKHNVFKIDIVYEVEENPMLEDNGHYLAFDLGVNNLLAGLNSTNGDSLIYDGKKVKAINQWFNKQKSKIRSKIDTTDNDNYKQQLENKLHTLSRKRHHKLKVYFHLVTNNIVNYCQRFQINTVIVGKNPQQKKDINIGKKNNQTFVSIPFTQLTRILEYKLKQQGIAFKEQNESYTSKCSFLDNEGIKKQENYQGIRITRGLFKSESGIIINADINGAGNILRRYLTRIGKIKEWFTHYFDEVIRGIVNYPQKITFACLQVKLTSNK